MVTSELLERLTLNSPLLPIPMDVFVSYFTRLMLKIHSIMFMHSMEIQLPSLTLQNTPVR